MRCVVVTKDNYKECLILRTHHTLYYGITLPLKHLCSGFHQIVPRECVYAQFTPDEFKSVMCGHQATAETFLSLIQFIGFEKNPQELTDLKTLFTQLTDAEREQFLYTVTKHGEDVKRDLIDTILRMIMVCTYIARFLCMFLLLCWTFY